MTQLDTSLSGLTSSHERLQKRSNRELRQLQEQIAILKDGMSQLSDAMLDEFTSIRRDMQHQQNQLQSGFDHSLQRHKLMLETDLQDFKATCIDADLGSDLRRIEDLLERVV
jgi:DNA anti-recombination protein RmuC